MNQTRQRILSANNVFFLVGTVMVMSSLAQAETKPNAPIKVLPQVATLTKPSTPVTQAQPVTEQREIRGQLTARRFTTIAAEVGAKISRLAVPEGSRFKAGQLLVRFDCSLQQAQLNKSRAALSAANATWDANKQLMELNSIGKVELDVSEADVQKNQAEVASMSAMLHKCNIHAPFSGIVSEQKARDQQYVQPGQALLEIIDDSALELEFIAPSKWLSWLKPGHPFDIAIDETGKSYPAKVLRLGGKVDPVSQSIKVVAVINGKFPDLLTGMSGRANISPPSP
jgi:RND family efflux transporter MFP subunit